MKEQLKNILHKEFQIDVAMLLGIFFIGTVLGLIIGGLLK